LEAVAVGDGDDQIARIIVVVWHQAQHVGAGRLEKLKTNQSGYRALKAKPEFGSYLLTFLIIAGVLWVIFRK
jgi:hypothetical protein